ncbi:MAG: hypothetical protein ACFHU9_01695 [Fluviicola sp.]
MAHEDFENIVKSRFQDFESKPPEAVWSNISNFRDRRKVWLLLLWLLPVLAIAGSAVIIYNAKSKTNAIVKFGKINTYTIPIKQTEELKKKQYHPLLEKQKKKSMRVTAQINEPFEMLPRVMETPSSSEMNSSLQEPDDLNAPMIMHTLYQAHFSDGDPDLLPINSYPRYLPSVNGFGVQIGTFITASRVNASWSIPPGSLIGQNGMEGIGNASYQRFLEISPYYQWYNPNNKFSFKASALIAGANISVTNNEETFYGNQRSLGIGLEGAYTFYTLDRLRLSPYLSARGESIFTRYSVDNSHAWFNSNENNNQNLQGQEIPRNYEQLAASTEIGVRGGIGLFDSSIELHGSVGYRYYFWQQNVPSEASEAVITIPNLINFQMGILYRLRK